MARSNTSDTPTRIDRWNGDGYTDQVPGDADRPFTVDDDGAGSSRISHVQSFQEASFDLTTYADADTFREVLQELDLPDEPAVIECYPNRPDMDHVCYVWANDELMLITSANPITGKHGSYPNRKPEEGYAGYMALEGTPGAVDDALTTLRRRASHVKDCDLSERSYI